jgi:hypothetical protein
VGGASYWAAEDFLEDVAVAVGLVFGAVAKEGNCTVRCDTLKESEREFLPTILDGAI